MASTSPSSQWVKYLVKFKALGFSLKWQISVPWTWKYDQTNSMVYLWGHFWWIRAGARRGASTFRELIAVHGDSHEMEVLVGNSRRFVHWGLPLTTLFVYWTAVVMGHVVKVLHSVGKLKTNDVLHAKYMGMRTYPWKKRQTVNSQYWLGATIQQAITWANVDPDVIMIYDGKHN